MIKKFFQENKIHKKIVPTLDSLFIFKPVNYFVIWVMVCVGMYLSTFYPSTFMQETNMTITDFSVKSLFLFLGITLLFGCINLSNDKLTLFKISNRMKNILFLISFILLLISDWKIFIIGLLIYCFSYHLLKNELFSAIWKELLLKVITCLLLIISGIVNSNLDNGLNYIISYDFVLLVLPYLLSYIAINILHKISDFGNSNHTTIISLENRKIVLFSSCLLLFAFMISFYLKDALLSTSIAVSLPFLIYALFRAMQKDVLRAVKYPIAILNLFVMFIYPLLFLIVLFVFYLSKYYYWHRFNIHFPTFLVDD